MEEHEKMFGSLLVTQWYGTLIYPSLEGLCPLLVVKSVTKIMNVYDHDASCVLDRVGPEFQFQKFD